MSFGRVASAPSHSMISDEQSQNTARNAVYTHLRKNQTTLDFGSRTLISCTPSSMSLSGHEGPTTFSSCRPLDVCQVDESLRPQRPVVDADVVDQTREEGGETGILIGRDLECCGCSPPILEYGCSFVLTKGIGMTGPEDKNNHKPDRARGWLNGCIRKRRFGSGARRSVPTNSSASSVKAVSPSFT